VNFDATDQHRITNSAFVKQLRNNYGGACGWVGNGVLSDISFSLVFQLNHLGYKRCL